MGKIKERVIRNSRSTIVGAIGGAVASAGAASQFGVSDWRILAGIAGAGLIAGAISKDPNWLKKKAATLG